jgi:hypothetical protein
MTNNNRLAAQMDSDFVVFLIGFRINKWWKIHKWFPLIPQMAAMLKELATYRELGLLNWHTWFGRTTILVQYWNSTEQLNAYAVAKDHEHLSAWKAFNKLVGTSGDVGIWHETYKLSRENYECVYVNMPDFGLGKAGKLVPAIGKLASAKGRMGA